MIVTVFGATGLVGKQIVKQALIKGYVVRAYGRNVFTAGFREEENLKLVTGAAFDKGQIKDSLKGADAVLSALGGANDFTDKTRSLGMKYITEQMEKTGVKRIVAVGGMGILESDTEEVIMDTPDFPKNFIAVSQEHWKAYQYLKESGLDWTMVCPPNILDAESTGLFHVQANTVPATNNMKINAGDLAMFMLQEITQDKFVKQRVGISN